MTRTEILRQLCRALSPVDLNDDPAARDAMLRWLDGSDGTGFGNPHSSHRMGRQAAAAIELARERVAALFPPGGKVIFTGGATEALNLAIRGSGNKGTVSYSAIEHSAVSDTAQAAGKVLQRTNPAVLGLAAPLLQRREQRILARGGPVPYGLHLLP